MKAGLASPNGITIQDVPQPAPGPADLLIAVKAIGLNRADLGAAKAASSDGKPIGIEFAGEVVATGPEVEGFAIGDRMMCHATGSHAEFALCDYRRALKVPDGMSYETAATLPVGLNTLHNALVTAGRLKPGENVLVQGASPASALSGCRWRSCSARNA